MTRRLLSTLALLALATAIVAGPRVAATADAAPAAMAARELTVEAELVDPPQAAPAPGTVRVVSVARFRVVRVVKGEYAHADLLVGFDGTAGLPGKVGERDRLVVVDRLPAHATVLNPFAQDARKLGLYYCTHLEAASAP